MRTLTPAAIAAINSGHIGVAQLVHLAFAPTPVALNSSNWPLVWHAGAFSRASTATYFDAAGVLQTAAVNELRIDHDPGTLLPRGVLIEAAATNLVRQSAGLNVTNPWFGGAVTASAYTYHGVPFWDVAKLLSGSSESRSQNLGAVTAVGQPLCKTIALQAGTTGAVSIGLYGTTTAWGTNGDCTARILEGPGTLTQQVGGLWLVSGLSAVTPTLVRITRTYQAAENAGSYLYPGGSTSTTIGHSILATRVQVEAGPTPTSYIPTTTATVTRAADLGAVTYLGAYGLGAVSPITDQPGQAQGITFELSGVDPSSLGLALDAGDVVQRTPARISTALIDTRSYTVVDAQLDWAGELDTMQVAETATGAVIRVTAESRVVNLLRSSPRTYSDNDQRRLWPDDGSFRHLPNQVGVPFAWPARSFFLR